MVCTPDAAVVLFAVPESVVIDTINSKNLLGIRLAAMKKLESSNPNNLTGLLVKLTADRDLKMRGPALQALTRIDSVKAFEVAQKTLDSGENFDKQLAIILLSTLKHPESSNVILKLLKTIKEQPIAIRLEILQAAKKRSEPALAKALVAYEASIDQKDPLAAFEITRLPRERA